MSEMDPALKKVGMESSFFLKRLSIFIVRFTLRLRLVYMKMGSEEREEMVESILVVFSR